MSNTQAGLAVTGVILMAFSLWASGGSGARRLPAAEWPRWNMVDTIALLIYWSGGALAWWLNRNGLFPEDHVLARKSGRILMWVLVSTFILAGSRWPRRSWLLFLFHGRHNELIGLAMLLVGAIAVAMLALGSGGGP